MILSKDIFIGFLLSSKPHINITKRHHTPKPTVEHFWLLPVKSREEFYLAFAEEHCLNFQSNITLTKTKYIRIADRTTLHILIKMIPPYLIEADQRLDAFCKIMEIIRMKNHLTQDGLQEIKLLRDKMMKGEEE
tara:strand:+ start:490 stop:891 length:402 start_codon:yes stop_codon:yes gene_type:complete